MDDERLFEIDSIPEVPLFREPRRSRGEHDGRFRNDYPESWHRCERCDGEGWTVELGHEDACHEHGCNCGGVPEQVTCPDCLGMGSLKARVRLEAGHRCVRCLHPYVPKGDAKMLGIEPSGGRWSTCDERCSHSNIVRIEGSRRSAEWRILTVHHLDGDKANCEWWNLAALCQRCHLEIQAKVVMERIYPHEHSEWFKPYVAAYYAHVYLGESLTRDEVEARMEELLDLERVA